MSVGQVAILTVQRQAELALVGSQVSVCKTQDLVQADGFKGQLRLVREDHSEDLGVLGDREKLAETRWPIV